MNLYLLFGLIFSAIVIVILGAIYYYSYEGFQSVSTEVDLSGAAVLSPDDFDLSGVNIKKVKEKLNTMLKDATADRRPVDSGERLCEGFINQITAMEDAMKYYRSINDWDNVRRTTETLEIIKKHQSEAGCEK